MQQRLTSVPGGTVLETADHYYEHLHSGGEFGFGRPCSSYLFPMMLPRDSHWPSYHSDSNTYLRLSTCLVLQVQSTSQMNSSGWPWYIFWTQQFFHAMGHVKLALGACQQACLWGRVFWPHISAARCLLHTWSPGRTLHWEHHTDEPWQTNLLPQCCHSAHWAGTTN